MKYLLLCPSNQDRNPYSGFSTNEYEVLHAIASRAHGDDTLEVTVIQAEPESRDSYRLEGLINQLDRARQYADALKADPADVVIVSLHSDSGTASHVFGCYDGGVLGDSYRLAETVAAPVASLFGVSARQVQLSGYLFYTRRGRYNVALIECGSHQNQHDIAILLGRQDEVAAAVVKGARQWWRLPQRVPQPIVSDGEAGYFSVHGVPYNPSAAIEKHWRALRALGVNIGPAVTGELDGKPYDEPGNIIQFFESAAIVCHPNENWACYLWQTFLHRSPQAA